MPTTYGSAVFKDFVSLRDATIVTKLKMPAPIIVAKTTMGEYAQGYLGSAFGAVHNAYDPTRSASGSSGGTGSGIAANYATVGIGEDTGGSIRGPAAVNNLVGLRPTVPLVSRFGMLPARPTTDTLGPIGRSVKDVALVLDVIAGYDPNDPVTAESVGRQPATYTQALTADGLKGARIGIIREPLDPRADTSSPEFKSREGRHRAGDRGYAAAGRGRRRCAEDPRSREPFGGDLRRQCVRDRSRDGQISRATSERAGENAERHFVVGKVVPSRARTLMNAVGHSTNEYGYSRLLARARRAQAVRARR